MFWSGEFLNLLGEFSSGSKKLSLLSMQCRNFWITLRGAPPMLCPSSCGSPRFVMVTQKVFGIHEKRELFTIAIRPVPLRGLVAQEGGIILKKQDFIGAVNFLFCLPILSFSYYLSRIGSKTPESLITHLESTCMKITKGKYQLSPGS